MPHAPIVSIITPSFNQGPYIERTIRSVLTQDYPHIEYFVADGGSTDGTLEILHRYAKEYPNQFRYVSEKDRGQSHALNKGIAATTGSIIGWMNSDDTFESGAVSTAVEFFNSHPDHDMVYGDANFIDVNDRLLGKCAHIEPFNFHRLVHYTDFIVQPASFFTRKAFEAVGGADESLHFTMDYDLFLKIGSKFKVQYIPKTLANFRWLGQNKSATGGHTRLDEIIRLTKPFGARGLPAYTRLEAAFLEMRLAFADVKKLQPVSMMKHLGRATRETAFSPRVWRSLVSPACWRVMYTGQVLRRAPSAST